MSTIYYQYERFTETNIFSGKYVRFIEADTAPTQTTQFGYTTTKPDLFIYPDCPYASEDSNGDFDKWNVKTGPQNYYTVKSGNSLLVKKNSVYEFENKIATLTLTNDGNFIEESSVFFTFTSSGTHTVNFPSGAKVVGSTEYWVNDKSYIITVYNGYYIIGVSKTI